MLDFGFSEILLTSAIALVVLGPERLPKVARQVGNWMGRARAMARQLSEQLEREVSAEELLREQTKPKAAPMSRLTAPAYTPPDPYASQFDPHAQPPHVQTAATDPSAAAEAGAPSVAADPSTSTAAPMAAVHPGSAADHLPPPGAASADPAVPPAAAADSGHPSAQCAAPLAVQSAYPVK